MTAPSTGIIDAPPPVLAQNNSHALFHVLGERLNARLKTDTTATLQKSYEGQCVCTHGWTHDSHQRMPQWQTSVLDTQPGAANLARRLPPTSARPKASACLTAAPSSIEST
jgi:peptidoglycan/xylan/chitin deacetylase (PgdA/CDA1 family)